MKRLDAEVEDHIASLFEEYAKREKRSKRAQLAWLIEEALKREGLLTDNDKGGQQVAEAE